MYENNYPNHYETINTGSSSGGSSSCGNNSLGSNSMGNNSIEHNSMNEQTNTGNTYFYEQPKPPKEKKQSGTGRKIALGICCGCLLPVIWLT